MKKRRERKMKKRLFTSCLFVLVALAGYLAFTAINPATNIAVAAKGIYSGTIYVAGMGGHFATFDLTVDPNNAENPLIIKNLDRIVVGQKATHPVHDPRIDISDKNAIFWATNVLDPNGQMHMGKSNAGTGDVMKDMALSPDKRSPATKPPAYCASGQTEKHYLPVFMGTEGYVDVVDKATLGNKHRLFVSDLGYKPGSYQFVHGTNSQDMKKFLVVINLVADGKPNGKTDIILVDMQSLENGQWKLLAKNTLSGEPGKTIPFRMNFTNDGKHIYQAAADRFWVIDAATLKLVDERIMPADNQSHDALPTTDGKYAVLTVRNLAPAFDKEGKQIEGKEITDGAIMLYDADAKKLVGKPVSICQACHKNSKRGDKSAALCGINANWKN